MALLGVNDEAGFRAHSASAGYQWDTALGVPISRSERVIIPHAVVESELRWLGHAFAEGREFTLQAGGGALLDQAIVAPGDFDQMCSSSPTIPDAVPLPRNFLLMLRSSILSENVLMKLALHRDSVIPVLKERLAVLKLGHVPPDGDDTKPREPLRNIVTYEGPMMQIIAGLQGIECLPELLKLEQRLFEIVDKMESDPSLPVPDFDFDNTYFYKGSKTEERRHGCKIVQREVLGLIKTLLLREGFQPLAESRFMAQEKNLKQTGPEKPNAPIFWQMPERDTLFGIPYSAEIRAELRGIAEQFLKSVPPEKWKAGSGIQLPFFDKP